jgi:hypothetical protein
MNDVRDHGIRNHKKVTIKTSLGWASSLLLAAGFAGTAEAASTTYDFTSGFIVLSADLGSANLLPAGTQIQMTGGQVTFDPSSMTLPSFLFTDNGPTTVAFTGAWSGESVTLTSINVLPGSTYSSAATFVGAPPPTYTFSAGNIAASGFYSLSGPILRGNTAFANPANSDTSLSGTISLGSDDTIQLTGITLGTITMNGQTVTLKGDIVFEGASPVPLPPSVWLMGSCLLALPLLASRKNLSSARGFAS